MYETAGRVPGALQPTRAETSPPHPKHHLSRWFVLPLAFFLVLWLWLFYMEGAIARGPNGKTLGADMAMFLAGAKALSAGDNLYDPPVLYHAERAMLSQEGLIITPEREIVRVGNPPLFFWALEPLTRFPFTPVALGWIVFLALMSALGFVSIARYVGLRQWPIALALYLAMPQAVYGPFFGNVVPIVLAGLGISLSIQRRNPYLSGILLGVGWLKPPVAIPLVLLIVLFNKPVRRQLLIGFALTTAVAAAFTMLVLGPHIVVLWLQGLVGYSRDIGVQPNVTSLAGLYVRWMPSHLRILAEGVCLSMALFATIYWFRHVRHMDDVPLTSYAWLWVLWFLATPYAHFYDEVLLTVPVLALIVGLGSRWVSVATVYLLLLSILLLSWTPLDACLLSLPIMMVAAFALRMRAAPGPSLARG